jgi:energy-coupling factor transporter ATP-binding protein EcfA2
VPNLEELIDKLKKIQLGLKQDLNNLHEKLEIFDSNPDLQNIIDNLKKDIDSRASNLEIDIERLREDLKNMRELLGLNLEKQNSGKT